MVRARELIVLAALGGCAPSQSPEVMVFAAASTAEALGSVEGIQVNAAASSLLARQIQAGAPAELFLSADSAWMDALGAQVVERVDLLGNEVVIAGREPLDDLTQLYGCVAMGDPEHVPAGRYGKAALQAAGAWQALAGQLRPAGDVRAALNLLIRSECPWAVVYRSDLQQSPEDIIISYRFSEQDQPVVVYPLGLLGPSPRPEAQAIFSTLQSAATDQVFLDHGFTPLP